MKLYHKSTGSKGQTMENIIEQTMLFVQQMNPLKMTERYDDKFYVST